MAEERITLERVKNHWQYSWWKYAILAIATLLGVDLLFSVTKYRVPEDKRVQIFLCNGYADAEAIEAELWPALSQAFPEQEELTAANIDLVNGDYYTQMQFTTYIAAQEGDVCLLPATQFRTLAEDGADLAFLELTPYVERGVIDTEGIDLSAGTLKGADGTPGLYGIPADALRGLHAYNCDPAGGVFAVMVFGGNDEVSATLLGQIVERFRAEAPAEGGAQGEETRLFR